MSNGPRRGFEPEAQQPRSGFEAKILRELDDLGVKYVYESPDSWLEFTQPAKKRKYLPDILLTTSTGATIYVEIKGKLDKDTKLKMELVKQAHPEKDIRIVFMRNNRMTKRTKSKTYTDWAEDKGFPCAVGTIPEEWLDE